MRFEAGFFGAGQMGSALALAAVKAVTKEKVVLCRRTPENSRETAQRIGCSWAEPKIVFTQSRFVFLGCKPQDLVHITAEYRESIAASQGIFVSMLAGISLSRLAQLLGAEKKILRILPNTPCSLGAGLTLFCANGSVSPEDVKAFRVLMDPSGLVDEIPEDLMDAAGTLSGCGPAYAYMFLNALCDGAVLRGVPRQKARQYAAQTLLGSARMVLESGKHPEALKDDVCSPGGSTIAGVRALETHGFRSAVMEALDAAVTRSKELG